MQGSDGHTVDFGPTSGNASPVNGDHADDEQEEALIHMGTPLDGHGTCFMGVFCWKLFRVGDEFNRRRCVRQRGDRRRDKCQQKDLSRAFYGPLMPPVL